MSYLSMRTRACASAAVACLIFSSPAQAHSSLEQASAPANSTYKAVMRIPHGCEEEATTVVKIQIPEGVVAVKPMPKAGWSVTTRKAVYSKSYDYFGRPTSEGVVEVIWSGGALPHDHYDEFIFQARLTADLVAGTRLPFATIQQCKTKSVSWVQVASPGMNAEHFKHPAPLLTIQAPVPAPSAASANQGPAIKVGALEITAAWTRQPPDGARVAGGYMKITNKGTEPDRLVGGAAAIAGRFEVHEMAMTDGVMRMRELSQGLIIKPGETVELKPGGLHLMYMDLRERPLTGRTVKTTLQFEKAGKIEIDVPVLAAPPSGVKSHHH